MSMNQIDHSKNGLHEALGIQDFFEWLGKNEEVNSYLTECSQPSQALEKCVKVCRKYSEKSENNLTLYELCLAYFGFTAGFNIEKNENNETLKMLLSLRRMMGEGGISNE